MKTVIGYRGQSDGCWDWRVPEAPDAAPAPRREVGQSWVRAQRLVSALRPHFPAAARPWLPVAGIALSAALLVSAISVIGSSDTADPGQAVLSAASPPAVPPDSAAGARIVAGLSARGSLVFMGFLLVILILATEVWFVRHSEPRRSLGDALDG